MNHDHQEEPDKNKTPFIRRIARPLGAFIFGRHPASDAAETFARSAAIRPELEKQMSVSTHRLDDGSSLYRLDMVGMEGDGSVAASDLVPSGLQTRVSVLLSPEDKIAVFAVKNKGELTDDGYKLVSHYYHVELLPEGGIEVHTKKSKDGMIASADMRPANPGEDMLIAKGSYIATLSEFEVGSALADVSEGDAELQMRAMLIKRVLHAIGEPRET